MILRLLLFMAAAMLELAGARVVWQYRHETWGLRVTSFVVAGLLLVLYAVVDALQPTGFGRTFAAYGAIFIACALLFGFILDRSVPDRWDLVGASLAIMGGIIIAFAKR